MYIVSVDVAVLPGNEEDFIAATKKNHLGTLGEEGAVRFDVLQSNDDPSQFVLYEVYHSEAAFRAHQESEHYLAWRKLVAEWMARPRRSIKCTNVFPDNEGF